MSIESSPELFINIKSIPDKLSKEYKPFFKEEMKKIKQGVTINGVKIPGWLYWHINHWSIDVDTDVYGERKAQVPDLRDNDWLIGEYIDRAETERKGLLILGTRQFGKSETGASYEGRQSIAYQNSQNVIASLSEKDLKLLISKIERGFTRITPYFRPLTILNSPLKQIILGYKNPQGEKTPWSEILIRNLDSGHNTEALAGPTASSLLIEEIGKGAWLESFIAAKPSLETPNGWRGMPLLLGTSGSFDKSEDLQKFRANLDVFNFLEIEMKDEKGTTISFFPGWRAARAVRKKIRLSTYLKKPQGSELDIIPIKVVADPLAEINRILDYRQGLKDAGEMVLLKKETMYYPLNEEELFLVDDSDNVFSDIKQLAKDHLAFLEISKPKEEYGWMTRDEGGTPKFVKAGQYEEPIKEFPTGEKEDKDAPIIIWDHPLPGQEFGLLHIAGCDPYNQEDSYYSPSLGCLYIYRRTYDPISGKHQERFVASYSARPKASSKWREQVRLLLEYYQATCLPENEDPSFIRFFDERNIGHYLEDGLALTRELNPDSRATRTKGLAASPKNIQYGNGLLKEYCNEDLVVGTNPVTREPIINKGIIRIQDKALLKEIVAFKPTMGIRRGSTGVKGGRSAKKATNVDRIVAARHALILAKFKDKYFPIAKLQNTEPSKKSKPIIKSPFMGVGNPFGGRKIRPF